METRDIELWVHTGDVCGSFCARKLKGVTDKEVSKARELLAKYMKSRDGLHGKIETRDVTYEQE